MLGDTSCISYSKKNPRVNKEMMMMMLAKRSTIVVWLSRNMLLR